MVKKWQKLSDSAANIAKVRGFELRMMIGNVMWWEVLAELEQVCDLEGEALGETVRDSVRTCLTLRSSP